MKLIEIIYCWKSAEHSRGFNQKKHMEYLEAGHEAVVKKVGNSWKFGDQGLPMCFICDVCCSV